MSIFAAQAQRVLAADVFRGKWRFRRVERPTAGDFGPRIPAWTREPERPPFAFEECADTAILELSEVWRARQVLENRRRFIDVASEFRCYRWRLNGKNLDVGNASCAVNGDSRALSMTKRGASPY